MEGQESSEAPDCQTELLVGEAERVRTISENVTFYLETELSDNNNVESTCHTTKPCNEEPG